ncbi:hypothetical protein [Natrinema sp. SYSU A 869]|uniref:hypothetical protein n=1 Tax=Natrinema sp. SYSU A 869 TaxID=2871694 RepID=UPI002103BBA9|nr:hypothetical protein [Natrinema sp. SYSU A 869]
MRTQLYLLPVAVIFVPIFAVPFLALLGHRGYETWVSGWGIELVVLSLAGMIFYLITVNRHVASLHERESILAEWTASPDTWYRRLIRGAGFGIGCGCFVGGILLTHSVDLAMNPLPAFGGAVIGQAITSGRTRTYTLFESGLCIRRSKTFNYQFVPRGQLRSVELTDDRLAIRRGLPWPLPIRCATRTMARPKRVTDALAQLVEPTPSVE